ncbi:hypothetical protein F5Y19DRAFT_424653 [Xylariaceae sp. FL1651]|nr:hypothetical protein F5Y19DRAFT_424653 [Xylariaceae sp. FL1651]
MRLAEPCLIILRHVWPYYDSARRYLVARGLKKPRWEQRLQRLQRRQRRRRQHTRVHPLPPLGQVPPTRLWPTTSTRHTSSQSDCLFLSRLSLDVRLDIYDLIFERRTLHIHHDRRGVRPLKKYLCVHPWGLTSRVHWSDCRRPQEKLYLLSLPLTCRLIYTETMHHLYMSTTLCFSSHLCLLDFLNDSLADHYRSLRRLTLRYCVGPELVTNDRYTLCEWAAFCRFFSSTFPPELKLYLDLDLINGVSTVIREADDPNRMQWLIPLWDLSQHLDLKLFIPTGGSGWSYWGKPPGGQRNAVIDFNEVKRQVFEPVNKREEVLAIIHERMKSVL